MLFRLHLLFPWLTIAKKNVSVFVFNSVQTKCVWCLLSWRDRKTWLTPVAAVPPAGMPVSITLRPTVPWDAATPLAVFTPPWPPWFAQTLQQVNLFYFPIIFFNTIKKINVLWPAVVHWFKPLPLDHMHCVPLKGWVQIHPTAQALSFLYPSSLINT